MEKRSLAIHCHFYQPPREDPLTGRVPQEDGAQPFHDWNEKIHATCYLPNAQIGNIGSCSFDVGPTLWRWMSTYHAETCKMFVEQENRQFEQWGVGNGMAHPYHHVILPLATKEEKITQVRWGLEDFINSFGHAPKGMWLPETAVDKETLDVVSDQGIEFIILTPTQASTPVDSMQCYRVAGTDKLAVFFYDQGISTRVSFDPLFTENADAFSAHVSQNAYYSGIHDPLLIVASDGELYGHHQPFRDFFLHRLVTDSLEGQGIDVTFPGRWLLEHQPGSEIMIRDDTSWSCPHGIERWRAPCECTPNGEWKTYLRIALNQLAGELDDIFLCEVGKTGMDARELRNQYIKVVKNKITVAELARTVFQTDLKDVDTAKMEFLLAAQYERLRMFTSCAWFFEDFDRIEPRNNVLYAAQAVWLTKHATGNDLSEKAVGWLKTVTSVRSGITADVIFRQHFENAEKTALTMKT